MSLGRDKTAQVAQDVPELSHTAWAADNPLRRVTSTQPLRPGWEPLPNSSLPERDGRSTTTGFARQAYNRVAAQRISSLVGGRWVIGTVAKCWAGRRILLDRNGMSQPGG